MIGQSLAHYEILDLLGQGGMGEVYRARDGKLQREVAIKVLPREMSGDPERIARFQREARTLATLQHANVASIYGFEDTPEARFLVMELVEGEELATRIARGALSIEECVEIARQIALGLEAAHEQGIVHRDLKPANIKVGPDGTVKILDFGLARAYLGEIDADTDPATSPTITAAMTQAGTILGTAAYMSPEQARGKRIEKRADIWAFGVILYEMLTGKRLFDGETVSDTLAGVLKTDIDLSRLTRETPPSLRWLLERCLERNPSRRLRDIGEARVLLEHPMQQGGQAIVRQRQTRRVPILVLGALAGVILGALLTRAFQSSPGDAPDQRQVQFEIPRTGEIIPRSQLSPDGTRLLYLSGSKLWIRELRSSVSHEVVGSEGALFGNWSPDGSQIVYALPRTIYRSRPDGSERARVCEVANDFHAWAGGVEWLEDGRIVFVTGDAGVTSVSASGGDPKVLLAPGETETDFHQISALPDGKGFLFHVHADLGFDTVDLWTGNERKQLLRMEGQQLAAAAYAAGHIVFWRTPDNPGVWAVPFSLESLEITGDPFLVVADAGFPSVSRRGDLAYVPESHDPRQIVRLNARGEVIETIGEPMDGALLMSLSPDATEAVLLMSTEDTALWIFDLATNARRRLTFTREDIDDPFWSRDGQWISYNSGGSDAYSHQVKMRADGSSSSDIPVRGLRPVLSSDNRYMVLDVLDEANGLDIAYVDLQDPDAEPIMLAESEYQESAPSLSPDDRYVVYESKESGVQQILMKSFPGGEGPWQVSQEGGIAPVWNASGDKIYFRSLDNGWIMVADVRSDPVHISAPRRAFANYAYGSLNFAPDGSIYALRREFTDRDGSYEIWVNWAASLDGDMLRASLTK